MRELTLTLIRLLSSKGVINSSEYNYIVSNMQMGSTEQDAVDAINLVIDRRIT